MTFLHVVEAHLQAPPTSCPTASLKAHTWNAAPTVPRSLLSAAMADLFETAVEEVKVLRTQPKYEEMKELYALYKQATIGDVNFDRPGVFNPTGRGKWDVWNRKKGMTQDEAKVAYVDLVEALKAKYGM
ncbi:acyl-CoA-binding protein-like isoform X2 [Nerophis ophidion]|uniref:acyl-CoA-binding protein-like isoform X2 n=1 Tax=Nerophis ophidion TaxID=159077 RepID=UPI002AE01B62|nr:acyl-CoA-binding protein-like isoform X2 [Nerophis ophidion]